MSSHVLIVLFALLEMIPARAFAAQSVVTEVVGTACMGDDRSRHQAEAEARADTSRKALEAAGVHVRSETVVKDMVLQKDLAVAYATGKVKILSEASEWYQDPTAGQCIRVRLKAEVVPDEAKAVSRADNPDDPAGPLAVKVWSAKPSYRAGEKVILYLKANKPFHARLLYRDAGGNTVQLLPNPYRKNAYFLGGVVYAIPGADDRFDLEVVPPFGGETVRVFASTKPLGDVGVEKAGAVFRLTDTPDVAAVRSRGIRLSPKVTGNVGTSPVPVASDSNAAEFAEMSATLGTSER